MTLARGGRVTPWVPAGGGSARRACRPCAPTPKPSARSMPGSPSPTRTPSRTRSWWTRSTAWASTSSPASCSSPWTRRARRSRHRRRGRSRARAVPGLRARQVRRALRQPELPRRRSAAAAGRRRGPGRSGRGGPPARPAVRHARRGPAALRARGGRRHHDPAAGAAAGRAADRQALPARRRAPSGRRSRGWACAATSPRRTGSTGAREVCRTVFADLTPAERRTLRLTAMPVYVAHDEYMFIRVLQSYETTFAVIAVHLRAALRGAGRRSRGPAAARALLAARARDARGQAALLARRDDAAARRS